MMAMMALNPELAKSMPADGRGSPHSTSPHPGSVYSATPGSSTRHTGAISIGSRRSIFGGPQGVQDDSHTVAGGDGVLETGEEELYGDDEIRVGHNFTFIPPNPKRFYKRLVEYCLTVDLETMFGPEVDDADEVPLTILSPPHTNLINECAVRWRIGQPYRVTCFLELIKEFYERGHVPMECIPEALQALSKVLHDHEVDKWPSQDVRDTSETNGSLFTFSQHAGRVIVQRLRQSLQHLPLFALPFNGDHTEPQSFRDPTLPERA